MTQRTVYRACNLCEAICGLEIKVDGAQITSIRGDPLDPFSRGHICPKAVALKDIHEDADRLRRPMLREGDSWREIGWEEALDIAAQKLADLQQVHGNNAVGYYAGNPSVHNIGTLFNVGALAKVLKSKNAFSATSVDQLPQQLTSFFMFGHQFLIPIPDIDRTGYFLVLGANPIASNGSMMTVPDVANRLKAIRARGGKVVVIDPRRTETAEVADEHHFIHPGRDAALLMALINVLRAEQRFRLSQPDRLAGLDQALQAIAGFTPEVAADATGIDADTIRRIAREFAASPSAVCYGRVGTTLQAFGTLCQWLVQLLNIVTGNLDRAGGALPTTPLIPIAGPGTRPGHYAQWRSRVSALPETGGELPVAALSEEILTPGAGQIRGLLTVCGNPVLSTPDGRKLDRALASLEFMVAVDIYRNETTRHAHLILPPASSLKHDHYDYIFNAFAVRNVTRFNAGIWPRDDDERFDWEILQGLAARIAARLGREFRPLPPTRPMIEGMLDAGTAVHGLTAARIGAAEHGIDLGALTPSLFKRLQTADGKVQCAPPALTVDVARFEKSLADPRGDLVMIGRRHVRSNNSWMHNSHRLVKGKRRDQLLMHPDDMAGRNIVDGQLVKVSTASGSLQIAVSASSAMMRGVASLPHGFGHDRDGIALAVAGAHPGASYNDLASTRAVDAVSGNAALNGIPIRVEAAVNPGGG